MKKLLTYTALLSTIIIVTGMSFIGYNSYKLDATPSGNPPVGFIHSWPTLDGSDNLVINYRLSDGTDKTFTAGGGAVAAATAYYTQDFTINEGLNGYVISNAGATTDIKGTFAGGLPDGFNIKVVNEVGDGGLNSYTKLALHFNNDSADSSLSEHTTTPTDMTYDNSSTNFKWGYSAVFNGSSSKISIADNAEFNLGLTSEPFTISCWIKTTDTSFSIATRGGGASDWGSSGHQWLLFYNAGVLRFQYNSSGSAEASAWTTSIPNNGDWHHIAVVYNGTLTSIAIDGVFGSSFASGAYTKPTTSNITRIGAQPDSNFLLNGKIDEFIIWKGLAKWSIYYNFTPPVFEYFYEGSILTLSPPSGGRLPNTSAINRNLVSSAFGDSLSIYKTADNFIGTSVFPAVGSWVDTPQ